MTTSHSYAQLILTLVFFHNMALYDMAQDIALCHTFHASTFVTTQESDPIPVFTCIRFVHVITKISAVNAICFAIHELVMTKMLGYCIVLSIYAFIHWIQKPKFCPKLLCHVHDYSLRDSVSFLVIPYRTQVCTQ